MARSLFNYEENRLEYGSLLMPEIGYDVEFAVAFTYSLDLEALLGVPVSLGMLDEMDSGLIENPFFLLEAIRKSSDKIAIFCNAGNIALPRNIRPVFALLENSVFEVNLKNMDNFHPKMWFIKYTNDKGESYIKLIVLSRNLTFDRSFDYAVEMTGKIGNRKLNKNKPLADMLKFTVKYTTNIQKHRKIIALVDDVMCVEKFKLDDQFEDYDFFPLGITPYEVNATGLFEKCSDLIVFSPFVSSSILDTLAKNTKYNKTLFTRKNSLNKQIIDLYNKVYITEDCVLDNEITSEGEIEPKGYDIHAKIYFTHKNDGNYLYVGSANASYKAFYKNIEFLVKLKFNKYMMSYDAMLKELIPEDGCPFKEIKDIEIDKQIVDTSLLDKAFRETIRNINKAEITPTKERFSITLFTNNKTIDKDVYIAPLFRSHYFAQLNDSAVFTDMLLTEFSEFYVIKIEDKQIITKIKTTGMPEDRDQAIYKSIIKDKKGFLAYVSLMLSDDYSESCFEQYEIAKQRLENAVVKNVSIPAALYERMLKCLVNSPHRLLELDNLMSKLGDDLITDDFKKMYFYFRDKDIAKTLKK